jgi:hypothetical protein
MSNLPLRGLVAVWAMRAARLHFSQVGLWVSVGLLGECCGSAEILSRAVRGRAKLGITVFPESVAGGAWGGTRCGLAASSAGSELCTDRWMLEGVWTLSSKLRESGWWEGGSILIWDRWSGASGG